MNFYSYVFVINDKKSVLLLLLKYELVNALFLCIFKNKAHFRGCWSVFFQPDSDSTYCNGQYALKISLNPKFALNTEIQDVMIMPLTGIQVALFFFMCGSIHWNNIKKHRALHLTFLFKLKKKKKNHKITSSQFHLKW